MIYAGGEKVLPRAAGDPFHRPLQEIMTGNQKTQSDSLPEPLREKIREWL